MEIFNVGILEIVLILVIAVIVLGPDGMVKSAHSMGRWLRKIIKSPIWAQLMNTQRELRDMPTRFVREAGLEEDLKELKKSSQDLKRTSQELRNMDITGGTGERPPVPPVKPYGGETQPAESPATSDPSETSESIESQPGSGAEEDHSIAPPEIQPQSEADKNKPETETVSDGQHKNHAP